MDGDYGVCWGRLMHLMTQRPATVDLLCTLAVSALHSYRALTLAKPLPKFLSQPERGTYDVEKAKQIMDSRVVAPQQWSAGTKMDADAVALLHYLVSPDCVSVRKISVASWLKSLGARAPKAMLPDFVFEVEHGRMRDDYPNALARAKHAEFVKAAEAHPVMLAYHGTELCNVYNILRESLKNDKNLSGRNGQVFGKGIYLSEEPMVAINFLHYGKAWKHCTMGHSLACLLECEVVCDPVSVLRGKEKDAKVPQNYVLVQNDCLVRVKRVLVYAEKPAQPLDYRWLGKWVVLAFVLALVLLATWKNADAQRVFHKYTWTK